MLCSKKQKDNQKARKTCPELMMRTLCVVDPGPDKKKRKEEKSMQKTGPKLGPELAGKHVKE